MMMRTRARNGPIYDPGEDDVGREVILYRWPGLDYEAVRIVSADQLEQVNKHLYHDINIAVVMSSLLVASDRVPNSVLMVLRRIESRELTAAVILDDLAVGTHATNASAEWKKSERVPKSGIRRWSVEMVRPSGRTDPKTLSGPEVALLCSFLFGWLGLDPQWMQTSARGELQVPFVTKKIPIISKLKNDPVYEDIYGYSKDLARSLFSGPGAAGPGGSLSTFCYPGSSQHDFHIGNRFTSIRLYWRLERDTSGLLGLRWGVSLSPYSREVIDWPEGPHADTPLEAIEASGALTTPEGLDKWLEDRWIPGEARLSDATMDAYEMLDVDPPPLMDLESFLVFMRN